MIRAALNLSLGQVRAIANEMDVLADRDYNAKYTTVIEIGGGPRSGGMRLTIVKPRYSSWVRLTKVETR